MQSTKEVASLSVTPSGCPMFQELTTRLHAMHNILALPLFHQAWKNLATQLDQVRLLDMKITLLFLLIILILIFSKYFFL